MVKPVITPKNSNTKLHFGAVTSGERKTGHLAPKQVVNSNARIQTPLTDSQKGSILRTPGNRGLNSERMRVRMVERIMEYGVTDDVVLDAMRMVPRHHFVDEALASRAYDDVSLPIGAGQTISQPWIVGHMIALARNQKEMRKVLEIGTGCGYQAAVLSCVSKRVYSIERVEALYLIAQQNLRKMEVENVHTYLGDGMLGLSGEAPFDAIILAAAGMEIPRALLLQLKVGGRLLAPVGGEQQQLIMVERIKQDEFKRSSLEAVNFVPLLPGIRR